MKKTICGTLILLLSVNTAFANGWKEYGDVARYAIPAIAIAISLFKRDFTGTKQGVLSIGVTQLATEGLKDIIDERRPNGSCCKSFPSGHVSAAFSGAAFLQRRYGWKYGVPAYAAATMVGVSRVKVDAHHPHDVIVGALLAIAINAFFTKPYKMKHSELSVSPMAGSNRYGAVVDLRF